MSSIVFQSAKLQAKSIRQRELKPSDLIEAHFDQIDKFNSEINAVIWQDRETAKELAFQMDKEVERGEFRGPLHGIPMTVKESFNISGAPTTWGDPQNKNNIAKSDSDAVHRLRGRLQRHQWPLQFDPNYLLSCPKGRGHSLDCSASPPRLKALSFDHEFGEQRHRRWLR